MSATDEFRQQLIRDGVLSSESARLTPLTGGVSSDIYRVDDEGRTFVIKRALPKLRVKDDWRVDVNRNRFEQEYLRYVGRLMPEVVPKILTARSDRTYFAMEYLGNGFVNWKQQLLNGHFERKHAAIAGSTLGTIHRQSAGDDQALQVFDSTENFHALRTDPYLLTTGTRHPELQSLFQSEATRLDATRECLVHGDFSPKNILWRADRMVLLDCEVAWYGDPAFDVAFLLNHLLLKSLYHARQATVLVEMARRAWSSYANSAGGGISTTVNSRLGTLLPMLLLARIDGKSPVEYLVEPRQQQFVRSFVHRHLPSRLLDVGTVFAQWINDLETTGHDHNSTG